MNNQIKELIRQIAAENVNCINNEQRKRHIVPLAKQLITYVEHLARMEKREREIAEYNENDPS